MTIADLPYIPSRGDGGPRSRTQVVVIHATDNTAGALAEASYASRRPDKTSAHFYVDAVSAFRGLPLGDIAYDSRPHGNRISVQFELCGKSNNLSDATMRRAAPLVAEICRIYGLPIRKIGPAEVRAGQPGICGHADITAAFPEDHGDHTDPGPSFPWTTFLSYVSGQPAGPTWTESLIMNLPTLREGSTGQAVRNVQGLLSANGVPAGPVDGDFGPLTVSAVRTLQSRARIGVDGVVGQHTWTALLEP